MQATTFMLITIINSFFYCKLALCLQYEFAGLQFLAAAPRPSPVTTQGFTLPSQTLVKHDPAKQRLLLR